MLTEAELAQMTLEVRGDLDNEELEALGASLGHYVSWTTTAFECDNHQGDLSCECGWKKSVRANWSQQAVQEHLEEIVGQRFDANGEER
jgi:hypothetical protein